MVKKFPPTIKDLKLRRERVPKQEELFFNMVDALDDSWYVWHSVNWDNDARGMVDNLQSELTENIQQESREFLNSKGIKHSDFRPQIITRKLLEKQDLILTMESSHVRDILSNFGNLKGIEKKTFTLKEFNGETGDLDIIDPYYTSKQTYNKVLKIIDENVKKAIKKIIEINQKY